jgi:hypothetical protein
MSTTNARPVPVRNPSSPRLPAAVAREAGRERVRQRRARKLAAKGRRR